MGRFDVFLKATWVETLSTALTAVRSFKPKGMNDLKSAVLKIDLLFGSLWRFGKTVEFCVSALWELNLEAVRCIWTIFDHVSLLFIMFKLKLIFWVSR